MLTNVVLGFRVYKKERKKKMKRDEEKKGEGDTMREIIKKGYCG
jgi:hypothetical protein